jgi:hypothetical protein
MVKHKEFLLGLIGTHHAGHTSAAEGRRVCVCAGFATVDIWWREREIIESDWLPPRESSDALAEFQKR